MRLVGGFASPNIHYWSSNELDYEIAWNRNFTVGPQTAVGKIILYYMRAIRAF